MLNILQAIALGMEEPESTGIHKFLNSINDGIVGSIAELVDNTAILFHVFAFVIILVIFLLTFKRRANRLSKSLINLLSKNGKYIKGLFVELNDAKELTRYFSYGQKWKKRIIKDYNLLFGNENGRRLDEIFKGSGVLFHLQKTTSVDELYNSIERVIDLIQKLRKREVSISDEYQKTAMLFEVYGRQYIEKLEKMKTRTEFIKNRYIVLTGSAGNGKTNLLCSLAELLMESNKICIFINSKEVKTNLNDYLKEKLILYKEEYFNAYWCIQNFLCMLFNRSIYIIIDAINENESQEFIESLPGFINSLMKYRTIKVIVSCRSEYFDLKYKEILVDSVEENALCYDIMSEEYSYVAKERMYENYKRHFNFSGHVSLEVKDKLYHQLLLMRMFFEVNKNSDAVVINLNKYEIFQRYIDAVMGNAQSECNTFLNAVVEQMCNLQQYSAVKLSLIKRKEELSEIIKHFIDETILLSRKIVIHPNSIIEEHDEEIYFVFDEMRDYCVAKFALSTLCKEKGRPVESKVIEFVDNLVASKSVSAEGVINYIYWYYKGEGNTNMCKTILYNYMQPHDRSIEPYRMHREDGMNSWGLKVIFENSNDLSDYEKEYVSFIMDENPGNELASMFAFLVHQEEICGKHNLELFLEMLFMIHDIQKFINVLKGTVTFWRRDGISQEEFIQIDMNLEKINPDGSRRFRYYLFLFVKFLQWKGKEELEKYLKKVCDIETVREELKEKIFFEEGEKNESEVQ